LLLWAFRRACSHQPTKKTEYYDALAAISKLERDVDLETRMKRLKREGKLTRKLNLRIIVDL
jgi:hypothetical protein